MSTIFKGSGVALVTPFTNGEVDYTALTRLIELQIISGTDAIIVCGTTGEAATMSAEERMEVIRFVVDRVNRRIPVIAGTGGNNTAAVIDFSRTAEALGVDGLLIVTPFYNKTTQKGLQVHIPIIVYNVPSRTGLNVLPATMREILDVCENVVGIKEASGNIEQMVNLAAMCPGLDIYSGNDDHILPVLSLGGKGVISTIANVVPSEVHNLCMAFFAGKLDIARKLQFSLLPIWRAAFCETNPIPIKTMMGMMDLCSPELRLPLVPPTPEDEEKMRKALKDFGLIS